MSIKQAHYMELDELQVIESTEDQKDEKQSNTDAETTENSEVVESSTIDYSKRFSFVMNELEGVVHEEEQEYEQIVETINRLQEDGMVTHHTIDDISNALSENSGGRISVSETERARIIGLYPKIVTKDMVKLFKNFQNNTEGQKAPILIAGLKTILVDSVEVEVNMPNLCRVWKDIIQENTEGLRDLYYNSTYVPKESQNAQWGDELRLFTSSCVINTKNRRHKHKEDTDANREHNAKLPLDHKDEHKRKDQWTIVEEAFGEGCEIREDMFYTMVWHYLITGELLMESDYMRLHALGTDLAPLGVNSSSGGIRLFSSLTSAITYFGLGASESLPQK